MKVIKLSVLALMLAGTWGGMYVISERGVTPDPTFEQALATEMNIPVGSFNHNKVRHVTELDLSGYGLTDLTGIEYFDSLESLRLSQNSLTALPDLSSLTNLKVLDVSFNLLEQLPPLPPNLEILDVEQNRLESLERVEDLTLTQLNVRDNRLETLAPLNGMAGTLTHLNARDNELVTIEALRGMERLTDINLRNNRITDMAALSELKVRDRLYVSGNGSVDLNILAPLLRHVSDHDIDLTPRRPTFSLDSGLYPSGQMVTLSGEGVVYYTLDGTEPTLQAQRFEEPIPLELPDVPRLSSESTTLEETTSVKGDVLDALTVRAASYIDGVFSPIETRTYVLKPEAFASSLPVVALTVDPADLFDERIGIFTSGDVEAGTEWIEGNYFQRGQDWERPVTVEWFEENGEVAFRQDAGIRVHGGYSRAHAQKSLRLYARSDYGQSTFLHPFFASRNTDRFERLLLRNGGNDWNHALLRDAYMQRLVEGRSLDVQASEPVIVMLNGEYWGVHNARELHGEHYLYEKYGVISEEMAILESNRYVEDGFEVDHGKNADLIHYRETVRIATDATLTEEERMRQLEGRIDIDNFLEYVAYQSFFGNKDTLYNNTKMWRKTTNVSVDGPVGHDGKWRWLVYDLDQGFSQLLPIEEGVEEDLIAHFLDDRPETVLFRSIVSTEAGEQRFTDIMGALLEETLDSERMVQILDEMRYVIEPELPRSIKRWDNIESVSAWESELDKMRKFAQERPDRVREQMKRAFE
ncbi:CotH kinase family protein [Exiguobacterium sp. SH0S1]|uniref:CotH kinase family protein n=1 Tax=Exiguobacterium sp. SH0S1 TaxID=2510949 RepID=UPI0013756E16|nr:CotH kinase family protein [Exiguobacterium sp. SH0S1]